MSEWIIQRLREVPVCELEGRLRCVRRILPADVEATWCIGQAAGTLRLAAVSRVLFREGDALTQAELLGAREMMPDRWLLPGPHGTFRTLRLFRSHPDATCLVTVIQDGQARQLKRSIYRLASDVVPAPRNEDTPTIIPG